MKKLISFYKKYFSQSFFVYLFLFIIAILCFLPFVIKELNCGDFLFNLGIGIFCSTLVTVLVDFGNTILQNKKDKRLLERLCSKLKNKCSELLEQINTSVYCVFEKRNFGEATYEEWVGYLFDFSLQYEKKQKQEIEFFLQNISTIESEAKSLLEIINNYYDNRYITEGFREKIDSLIRYCRVLKNNLKNKKYAECKHILIKELKNSIIEIFQELNDEFSKKYSEEDFMA